MTAYCWVCVTGALVASTGAVVSIFALIMQNRKNR